MGGRGSTSATKGRGVSAQGLSRDIGASDDKQLIMEALERVYQQGIDSNVAANRQYAENAGTAQRLIETDIGQTLIKDPDFKEFRAIYKDAYTNDEPAHAMSNVDNLIVTWNLGSEYAGRNMPMHLERDEWIAMQEKAVSAWQKLDAKGYTEEQIAAANGFHRLISQLKSAGTVPALINKKGPNLDSYSKSEREKITEWGMRHFGLNFADAVYFLRPDYRGA